MTVVKKGIAPFRGRTKRCKSCGKVKPVTEFSNTGHKSCSACVAFTHGGRSVDPVVFAQQDTPRELYDGSELRPLEGRAGAMDAYSLPSRGAFL